MFPGLNEKETELETEKVLHGRNPDPGEEKSRRKQRRKSPLRSEEEKANTRS